jgi:hypothetical protein
MKIYNRRKEMNWKTKIDLTLLKWGEYLMFNPKIILILMVPFLGLLFTLFSLLTAYLIYLGIKGSGIFYFIAVITLLITYKVLKISLLLYKFKKNGMETIIDNLNVDSVVRGY